jgi:hypothetical protein
MRRFVAGHDSVSHLCLVASWNICIRGDLVASHVHEPCNGEMNVAGPPGFEPGKAVLETAVIPFHYSPMNPIIHFFPYSRKREVSSYCIEI